MPPKRLALVKGEQGELRTRNNPLVENPKVEDVPDKVAKTDTCNT